MNKKTSCAVIVAILIGLWLIPTPQGLTAQAWKMFAVFVATIVGFILQPIPMGAVALVSMTFATLTGLIKMEEILATYGNFNIWLIFSAFLIARGLIKTGLGRRVAFVLISCFGSNTLRLAYAMALSDLVLAPATPSNSARAGGVTFPIVRSLCSAFGSEPGPTARRVGSFLMLSSFNADAITSAMFLTAMSGNLLCVDFAAKAFQTEVTWGTWALAGLVPGLVSLAVIPLFLYIFFKPELKETPEAQALARTELVKMGLPSQNEKIVAFVFVGALILWSTATFTQLSATLVAFLAVSVMLVTSAITWDDVLSEKSAWDTLFWIGTLMGLAGFLAKYGFIGWFAKIMSAAFIGMSGLLTLFLLVLVYIYSHYGFASLNAHITAMYPAFLAVSVAAGAPVILSALCLGFAANLCLSLTHYASGPAPIFFGAGYVSQSDWWNYGFAISVINIIIWTVVGGFWWKMLGLW